MTPPPVPGRNGSAVRRRPCYACGAGVEPWPCETCQGPEVVLACRRCHDERRHGVVKDPGSVRFCGGPPAVWKDDASGASASWDSIVRASEDGS